MDENKHIGSIVDHLFRTEAAKLNSVLTRIFGPSNLNVAEDIVQETLIAAMDSWVTAGVPANPAAWITQVAKRNAINELKRDKTARSYHFSYLHHQTSADSIEHYFHEGEIQDSQLRMIFTCCHPLLSVESQICLNLKILCGFGYREIAHALMTNEETIQKRLYRAKEKIRSRAIPFDIPSGAELETRLKAVCLSLYLLFNEGYKSSNDESLIRKHLCLEAIRLTFLLTQQFKNRPELFALLSLMCFHAARFESRSDVDGAIVLLEDQDRSKWNQELISKGLNYLHEASSGSVLSEYHLEAGIAAEHCLARSFSETNWQSLYQQYKLLYALKKNPIVRLNMAIITAQTESIDAAIRQLEDLREVKELVSYYLLPATLGTFYLRINMPDRASKYLLEARSLARSIREKQFLDRKLKECRLKSCHRS